MTEHASHDPNPAINMEEGAGANPKEGTFHRMKEGLKHMLHHNEEKGNAHGPDYVDSGPNRPESEGLSPDPPVVLKT